MAKGFVGFFAGAAGVMFVTFGFFAAVSAGASPVVRLSANMHPDALGKPTVVSIGFQIPTEHGEVPPPLAEFAVQLPAEMGLGGSALGVSTCSTEVLLSDGPDECPEDAVMGYGSAVVDAYLGAQVVSEPAGLSIFMARPKNDETTLLYYFDGKAPVIAPIVLSSVFSAVGNSPISELRTTVPTVTGLPETPNVAIVDMSANIGGDNLIYRKHVGDKVVAYRPAGMAIPQHCPRGGFRFAGYFGFEDGAHATTTRYVPCPH
jgi:hypothetical protein